MATTAPATQTGANGLATYFNVLFAPNAAFAQLALTPMWGWAAVAGMILMLAAMIIMLPEQQALAHVMQMKQLATMPADQAAQAKQAMAQYAGISTFFIVFAGLIVPWVSWLLSSIVFVIGAAVSGAQPKFSMAWVAAVNASAVAWVVAIVNSIIVAIGGPDQIGGPMDIQRIPSLAMLFPGSPKLDAFLATFSIGYLWFYIVAVIALERVLRMSRPAAIVTVLLYALLAGGIGAAFAR